MQVLLSLLRLALDGTPDEVQSAKSGDVSVVSGGMPEGVAEDFAEGVDWQRILDIARAQGVAGVAFDGLSLLFPSLQPVPSDVKMRWIGQLNHMEQGYGNRLYVAGKLARLWASEGIEPVALKGLAFAQYYPEPSHRYSSDLDVFISGNDWDKACKLLEDRGVSLVREVYKEVEFHLRGVYVECHRCITPYRGNEVLKRFELYLRSLLSVGSKEFFDGTSLVCPPLMFNVMLCIEHALGDLLHGKLSLKHIVDWCILRRKLSASEYAEVETKCTEFGFERFLKLINALSDVVSGRLAVEQLSAGYLEVFESLFRLPSVGKKSHESWFVLRVKLFFEILQNRKFYSSFGYCSMEKFLFNSLWTHFFDKRLDL